MRAVSAGNVSTLSSVGAKVNELCDASQQVTEEIADAYTLTVPAGFVPVRSLDLTNTLTPDMIGAVLVTFLQDMQRRGVARRTSGV